MDSNAIDVGRPSYGRPVPGGEFDVSDLPASASRRTVSVNGDGDVERTGAMAFARRLGVTESSDA